MTQFAPTGCRRLSLGTALGGGERALHSSPVEVAGGHPSLFTNKACGLVHRLTRGNPRLINQVCDVALTYGFAEQERVITSKARRSGRFRTEIKAGSALGGTEELSALASAPEDATRDRFRPSQPSSPQPRRQVHLGTHSHAFGPPRNLSMQRESQ